MKNNRNFQNMEIGRSLWIFTKKIPLVMKLFIFYLFCSIGMLQAVESYAQNARLSLNVEEETVANILQQIENASDFDFFYNNSHVDLNRRVSVSAQNSDIFAILKEIFEGTEVRYTVLDKKIILSTELTVQGTQQQGNVVKGKVVDTNGEPVIGATIKEVGTDNGTVTDIDGNFTINTQANANLEISFIGYQSQTVKAVTGKELAITLKEDTEMLDEVVVVAFGTQKKSSLTSSIAAIDSEKLGTRPVTNMGQSLQGMLPGLNLQMDANAGGNINSSLSINVRGTGTIGQDSNDSPLVLIDGVEGDMNMINPQDVENISVLKDASASSIYGSRAAFGVILITTKQGKQGKCKINYSNNLQIAVPQVLPTQMDSYTYVNYINQAYKNDGLDLFFPAEQVEKVKQYQEGTLLKEGATTFDPLYTVDPLSNGLYRVRDYWGNTDWLDLLTKDQVFSHEHNLSFSGGGDKMNYYVSGNFLNKSGIAEFVDDNFNRYSFMARMNVNCTDWMKLQTITRFVRTDYETASAASGTYKMWSYIPTAPLYDPYGNYNHYETLLPLMQGGRYKSQKDVITNSLQLILEPIKDWIITADATYRINTIFNHNDIQQVTAYDGNNQPYFVPNQGKAAGYTEVKEHVDKSNFFSTSVTSRYHRVLWNDHDFDLLLGFQYEKLGDRSLEGLQDGIITPSLPTLNTTNGINDKVTGGYSHWATAGFFGRLNYAYLGKYLAEVKLRYDGSSRFLDDKRWNWFPSLSLGWNIARENFMAEINDYVSSLKLRLSLGTLGNQNTTNLYPFYSFIPLGAGTGSWLVGGEKTNTSAMPGLVSQMLGWETIRDYNIGLDFGFFNNRLTGSIDYYHRYTDDMVGPGVEKPNTLGTAVPVVNNADLVTRGFEIELSWRDRLASGLGYGVRFVLSDSQTEVLKYPNEQMKVTDNAFYNGKKLGEIWGYDVIGIAQTQEEMDAHLAHTKQNFNGSTKWQAGDLMYLDRNGDGEINTGKGLLSDMGDQRVIGNSTPRYNFGLTLDADYKGWFLSLFFNGTMKRDFWTGGRALWGATGGSLWGSAPYMECLDYFRPADTDDPLGPNLNGYLPAPSYTNKNKQVSTAYLQNAAYIKLKNVQLGYTFPKGWIEKLGIDSLRLYTSIENLWTGSKIFDTIDPEMLNASANFYPLSTTYSFGLNVTF